MKVIIIICICYFMIISSFNKVNAVKTVSIERVSGLSLLEFYTKYALKDIPVIITDIHHLYRNMTIDTILKYCGDLKAYKTTTGGTGWAGLDRKTSHPLKVIYSNVYNSNNNNDEDNNYGVFDFSLGRHCSELLRDNYLIPKYIAQDFLQRVPPGIPPLHYRDAWPSLFIGKNNSFGGLHIDVLGSAFWQYVIDGTKEWHVLSPVVNFPYDYTFFSKGEQDDEGQQSNIIHYYDTVKQGEFIFIPGNCPHQVKNIGNTIALAGNIVSITEMDSMEKVIKGSTAEYYVQLQNTLLKNTFDRRIRLNQDDYMSWMEYKTQFLQYPDIIGVEHLNLLRNYYDILDDDENAVTQEEEEVMEVMEVMEGDGNEGTDDFVDIAWLEELSSLYSSYIVDGKPAMSGTRYLTVSRHVNFHIISMRTNRLMQMYDRIDNLKVPENFIVNAIHFPAINGTEVWDYVPAIPYKKWKGECPFENRASRGCKYYTRDITKGELGCTLSHLGSLANIQNDPVDINIVVEDDVHFNDDMLFKLRNVWHELPEDWDMLYLARHKLGVDKEYSENLLKPGRSWGGWAIVYSEKGVSQILRKTSIIMDNLIAWDEIIPAMQGVHFRQDITDLYMDKVDEPLNALALKENVARVYYNRDDLIHDTDNN